MKPQLNNNYYSEESTSSTIYKTKQWASNIFLIDNLPKEVDKEYSESKKAIEILEKLEDDWNGFGALSAKQGSIENSKKFIEKLPFNRTYPSKISLDEGDVVMSWNINKELIEVIIEPNLIHLYKKSPDKKTEYVEDEIFYGQKIPQTILKYIPEK